MINERFCKSDIAPQEWAKGNDSFFCEHLPGGKRVILCFGTPDKAQCSVAQYCPFCGYKRPGENNEEEETV